MNQKTPKKFENGKTISELGIDKTRRFVLLNDNKCCYFHKGDVLEIIRDDDDYTPIFMRIDDGKQEFVNLEDVYYFEEHKKSSKKFTQYFKRWDNIIFEEDVIGGISLEKIKADHKDLGDKLKQHKKLFPKLGK